MDDTIFTSPTKEGTAILRCHPSHAISRLQGKGSTFPTFSVILRP